MSSILNNEYTHDQIFQNIFKSSSYIIDAG